MSNISATLDEIVREASKIGIPLGLSLCAGVEISYIEARAAELPFGFPSEVYELYTWRNGTLINEQPYEISFVPKYLFMPLDEAVEVTQTFITLSKNSKSQWQPEWFCLFADTGGGYYTINTNAGDADFGRIFTFTEMWGARPVFWSVEQMAQAVLQCYRSGAYFLDADGFLEERHEVSDLIYRMYNHGLSPLPDVSMEKLAEEMKLAKLRCESENRPALMEKLRGLARSVGINFDDL